MESKQERRRRESGASGPRPAVALEDAEEQPQQTLRAAEVADPCI